MLNFRSFFLNSPAVQGAPCHEELFDVVCTFIHKHVICLYHFHIVFLSKCLFRKNLDKLRLLQFFTPIFEVQGRLGHLRQVLPLVCQPHVAPGRSELTSDLHWSRVESCTTQSNPNPCASYQHIPTYGNAAGRVRGCSSLEPLEPGFWTCVELWWILRKNSLVTCPQSAYDAQTSAQPPTVRAAQGCSCSSVWKGTGQSWMHCQGCARTT